jgi:hypothetical protein
VVSHGLTPVPFLEIERTRRGACSIDAPRHHHRDAVPEAPELADLEAHAIPASA